MYFDIEHVDFRQVLVGAGGLCVLYWLKNAAFDLYHRRVNDKLRAEKIASLAKAKAEFATYLSHHPMPQDAIEEITRTPLLELIEKLRTQQVPPAYVLLAYQHKAFQADEEFNCVVEFLPATFEGVNMKGPLAGAPVSLKECIGIKGLDNCVGCVAFLVSPQQKESVALQTIRSLGGVPFVRTTVPQTMMSTQCSNPIDGITRNPLRKDRTSHGSSGGEAALIAAGGSPLGFGTDIGGSIRLPAAMCGIVGFKPTSGRLSYRDLSVVATTNLIAPTWGPLCRDVASCQVVVKELINNSLMRSRDPESPPVPFEVIPEGRHLRIGVFTHFKDLVPVPAVRRAVLHVREKLRLRGHEVVEWQPPFMAKEYLEIFLKSIFADGFYSLKRLLAYDVVDPSVRGIYQLACMPWHRRWWLKLKLNLTGNWEVLSVVNAITGFPSVADLQDHLRRLHEFRQLALDSLAQFDALLCPAVGWAAALPINPPQSITAMLAFQSLANTLTVPAGCLPSGCRVEERDMQVLEEAVNGEPIKSTDPEEVTIYKGYGKLSPTHAHMLALQRGTEGLPIPVQFMALPWRDELCLHAMREAELAIQSPEKKLPLLPGTDFLQKPLNSIR